MENSEKSLAKAYNNNHSVIILLATDSKFLSQK